MTTNRIDVILNEVKDLYDTSLDDAVLIPQLSVMNPFLHLKQPSISEANAPPC